MEQIKKQNNLEYSDKEESFNGGSEQTQVEEQSLNKSKSKETRVLFITLLNNVNNTVVQHSKYYQAFSKYGEVQRILIFQKIYPWATLIEMDTAENARRARTELTNTQILEDGTKMIVIPSQKERIEFQEKNSAGIDYTKIKQKIMEKKMNSEAEQLIEQMLRDDAIDYTDKRCISPTKIQLTASEYNEMNLSQNSSQSSSHSTAHSGQNQRHLKGLKNTLSQTQKTTISQSNQKFSQQTSFEGEESGENINYSNNSSVNSYSHQPASQMTDSINQFDELNLAQSVYGGNNDNLQKHTQSVKIPPNFLHYSSSDIKGEMRTFTPQKGKLEKNTQKQVQNMINSAPNENINKSSHNLQANDIYENVDENTNLDQYVHPQFSQITKKSKVIYANRFDPLKITTEQLFNLFSAFGNIVKIIFMKSKSAVLVEYSNTDYACQAKDYLSDKIFNGNVIKIFYSRYDNIFFKDPEEKPADEEYYQPDEKLHRFKPDVQGVVNPPIDTLHISNLRREACVYDVMKKVFESYGQIKNVKFMLEKNNKNMCLVKFDNASIAMWALANVHNKIVNDRPLKISFSKRTLD